MSGSAGQGIGESPTDGAVAFDTTIRRLSTAQQSRVSNRGLLALIPIAVLAVVLHFYLPQHAVRDIMEGVIALFAMVYLSTLSRAMTPLDQPARVWVGPRGLWTDNGWLAEQGAIRQAHVCQPVQAGMIEGVKVRAWPWTVMIGTDSDRFWLIARDEDEGRRLLECLGRAHEVRALGG